MVARRSIEIQDDPVDTENDRVLGEWVRPDIRLGMSDLGRGQHHHPDTPLIVAERRDLPRVRRPLHHGTVATDPSGVIRAVAEVFESVRRQLGLFPGIAVTDPQVVFTDVDDVLSVRRHRFVALDRRVAVCSAHARVRLHVASGGSDPAQIEHHVLLHEGHTPHRNVQGCEGGPDRVSERLTDSVMVEGSALRTGGRVDHDVLRTPGHRVLVPEPPIVHPARLDRIAVHEG